MHSVHNSNTFLAYFNQIDKYLSHTLWLKKYVPYHERITMISTGKLSISRFVQQFEDKLRYFGDLRNQLVHGFRLDNRHYLIVSDHAIDQITSIHDELTKPKTVADVYTQQVIIAQEDYTIADVLLVMKKEHLKYMPVMQGASLQWVLSFQDIIARLVDQPKIDTTKTTLLDIDVNVYAEYVHISSDQSIYEIQTVFADHTDVEILLITQTWSTTEPLLWIVHIHDLPTLQTQISSTGV